MNLQSVEFSLEGYMLCTKGFDIEGRGVELQFISVTK